MANLHYNGYNVRRERGRRRRQAIGLQREYFNAAATAAAAGKATSSSLSSCVVLALGPWLLVLFLPARQENFLGEVK